MDMVTPSVELGGCRAPGADRRLAIVGIMGRTLRRRAVSAHEASPLEPFVLARLGAVDKRAGQAADAGCAQCGGQGVGAPGVLSRAEENRPADG